VLPSSSSRGGLGSVLPSARPHREGEGPRGPSTAGILRWVPPAVQSTRVCHDPVTSLAALERSARTAGSRFHRSRRTSGGAPEWVFRRHRWMR